ncbi:hypothetical protein WHI96_16995 [Pseudonocardia tropica]|uniref:Uncharacterized protein n=1 Tax=Pseudonocardia tropica TaxID=681289 RepID=A0ABV1JYW6_9PSEU
MVTGRGAAGTRRDDDAGDTADRVGAAGVAARFGRGADDDASPPVFGTAPWGYRRAEVDAWASWVARLVEQGRRETVRADSAEATLRATLQRLDELERRRDPAPGTSGTGDPAALPRRRPGAAGAPVPPGSEEGQRLRVVETTLGEVMALLQRLAP